MIPALGAEDGVGAPAACPSALAGRPATPNEDKMGGTWEGLPPFQDVCLINALQALGYPVPHVCDGPFNVNYGNERLRPFGMRLAIADKADVAPGDYVDGQGSKGPRVHRSKGPRVQGSKGPQVQGPKGPRVQGSKGPRVQYYFSISGLLGHGPGKHREHGDQPP